MHYYSTVITIKIQNKIKYDLFPDICTQITIWRNNGYNQHHDALAQNVTIIYNGLNHIVILTLTLTRLSMS